MVDHSRISALDECVFTTTKMKVDLTEAPSPTSSIHSVRPLEWDSGADIGYQCKLDSGLSTVERIGFVSGTDDLLENVTHNSNKERSSKLPLAQSSPLLCTLATVKRPSSSTKSNEFSTSLNGNNDKCVDESPEQTESNRIVRWFSEMDIVAKSKICKADKSDITVRSQKNSKSLNDVSSLKCNNRPTCTKNVWSCNTKVKNMKSSLQAHLVSHSLQPVILSPKHIGKCSYMCMDKEKNSDASDRDGHKRSSSETENKANGRESGSCSFEYVPGCVYDSRHTDKSAASTSTVNSFSNEVTGGVELLLKYVNSLQVPHKQKILKKVIKFILNLDESTLARLKVTDEEQRSDITEGKNSSSPSSACKSSIRSSYLTSNSGSNHKTDSSSNVQPRSSKSCSRYTNESACTTGSCLTIGDSKRSSSISLYYRGKESDSLSSSDDHARSSSCMHHRSSFCSKSSDKGNRLSSAYSLKQYLIKERETHLRWIKSNIEHLNNLKRLCESQKILRNELNELQKSDNSRAHPKDITPSNIQTDDLYRHQTKKLTVHHQLLDKNIESPVANGRKMSSCEVLSSYSKKVQKKSHSRHKNKCSNKEVNLGNKDFVRHVCFCKHFSHTSARKSSGNKENIPTTCTDLGDRSTTKPLKNRRFLGSYDAPKYGVYYTLLFDKKRRFRANKEQFKAEAHAKEKSGNRLGSTEKESETRTASTTQIQRTSNELKNNNVISLQEYLMRNKPSFYNKAEYRRQCLSEIAKLRELRDKSRRKLWLTGEGESGANLEADKISNIAPLPMSVFRIFDEREMKEETKKKYYQLPEVKNKNLEVGRQLYYHRNRLMAEIFAKKLQKKVLRGKVHLGNNVNLMAI